MKIDFYDLFSLHTPKDFSQAGEDNYITAAVKSRVMENIHVNKSKPVRINRIGRAVIAAAAAVVVLAMGTLAASALGLIDLERIFGSRFNGGFEHLENISSIPQNVVTTGDDRLSLTVLGIAGTDNEALVTIEVKRNDGGTFPETIIADDVDVDCKSLAIFAKETIPIYSDNNTAVFSFALNALPNGKIVGDDCKITIKNIRDYINYTIGDILIEGEWSVAFTLDYNSEYRTIDVNGLEAAYEIFAPAKITEIGYSSISMDIYFDSFIYDTSDKNIMDIIEINIDNGEKVMINNDRGYQGYADPNENYTILNYSFEKPVDIDSIESITIGDVVIPVK